MKPPIKIPIPPSYCEGWGVYAVKNGKLMNCQTVLAWPHRDPQKHKDHCIFHSRREARELAKHLSDSWKPHGWLWRVRKIQVETYNTPA
jgi:hypothetical protein